MSMLEVHKRNLSRKLEAARALNKEILELQGKIAREEKALARKQKRQ